MAPVQRLPHDFADPSLLDLALSHASVGRPGDGADNERLEFLGDAVLDLVVAEELYRTLPAAAEGDLTELKSRVVSRRALAGAARDLGLEAYARVGPGMRGRALSTAVLANLYEAVLGAVYLDSGYGPARSFSLRTLGEALEDARTQRAGPNPKQSLQQYCQKRTGVPPVYRKLDERGRAHAKAFLVAAQLEGTQYPSAWGRTLKEAERWAAHEALGVLEEEAAT
jgi:ribonuclease-3